MKFRVIAAAAAAALSVPLLAQLPANAQAATSASVMVATGHTKPGLVVDLYAWPSNQVLQHLKAGQLVPTKLIARTTASTTGVYSLTVSRAALKAAATTGRYANLEIDAGSAVWFTTEAAASPAITTGHLAVATPDRCTGWRWYKKLKPATGTVGQSYVFYSSGSGVRQSFTYAVRLEQYSRDQPVRVEQIRKLECRWDGHGHQGWLSELPQFRCRQYLVPDRIQDG